MDIIKSLHHLIEALKHAKIFNIRCLLYFQLECIGQKVCSFGILKMINKFVKTNVLNLLKRCPKPTFYLS